MPSSSSRATPVPRVGHIQPGYRSPPLQSHLPLRSPSSNTSPPARIGSGQGNQPHLVSLVLQSKKSLQLGQQLCARAHTESNASAQAAVDILALDAKVKWLVDAVVEQLKVPFFGYCIIFLAVKLKVVSSLLPVLRRVLRRNGSKFRKRLL